MMDKDMQFRTSMQTFASKLPAYSKAECNNLLALHDEAIQSIKDADMADMNSKASELASVRQQLADSLTIANMKAYTAEQDKANAIAEAFSKYEELYSLADRSKPATITICDTEFAFAYIGGVWRLCNA